MPADGVVDPPVDARRVTLADPCAFTVEMLEVTAKKRSTAKKAKTTVFRVFEECNIIFLFKSPIFF